MKDDVIAVSIAQRRPIPLSVSFTCAPGECIVVVGPSGAGKTTILRAIAGLYEPAAGRITCGDQIWFDSATGTSLVPQQRRVGLVFQSYALFPHLNALRNVTAAMSQYADAEQTERARAILASVHLDGLQDRKPSELSGGQQQRVALARALARDPAVLLLDEPFSAVDRRTRRKLREELKDVRSSLRAPMVLVTHDLDDAGALADRMLVLDRGEVIQDAPPGEVMRHPASNRVREAIDVV